MESIIGLLSPSHDRDTHDNSSRLLIEMLRVARDGQLAPANERCDDPLLNTLEDTRTIQLLLDVILPKDDSESTSKGNKPSAIVNGICVLMALLEARQPSAPAPLGYSAASFNAAVNSDEVSPEEAAQQRRLLNAAVDALVPRLGDFTTLLSSSPETTTVKTSAGVLDPPLGETRLR